MAQEGIAKNFLEEEIGSYDFFDSSITHDRFLAVEDKKFHVISGILALSSEFFNIMLNGSFREKNETEIVLRDVGAEDFKNFLNVIYPMGASVDETNLRGLMKLSGRFMSPFVWQKCMKYLESEENFKKFEMLDLLEWSENCNSKDLKDRIENALVAKFPSMKEEHQFDMGAVATKHNMQKLGDKVLAHLAQLLELSPSEYFSCFINNKSPECPYFKIALDNYVTSLVNLFGKGVDIKILDGPSAEDCRYWFEDMLIDIHHKNKFTDPAELDILLRLAKRYRFGILENLITNALVKQFVRNKSFVHIKLAVKYDLKQLMTLMEHYLSTNVGSIPEESKNFLFNISDKTKRFVMKALVKHNCQNKNI